MFVLLYVVSHIVSSLLLQLGDCVHLELLRTFAHVLLLVFLPPTGFFAVLFSVCISLFELCKLVLLQCVLGCLDGALGFLLSPLPSPLPL